ncbi:MAG: DUF3768 domain-containing protein [Hyphomonadaceae bacterium]|nr:DUF3768 domain-containing protein [Hyphomonadaceae bacterium]
MLGPVGSAMTSSCIAAINDRFRTSFFGGRVFITEGVRARGFDFESAAVEAVQSFKAFGADNDPYNEHDFGSWSVSGEMAGVVILGAGQVAFAFARSTLTRLAVATLFGIKAAGQKST